MGRCPACLSDPSREHSTFATSEHITFDLFRERRFTKPNKPLQSEGSVDITLAELLAKADRRPNEGKVVESICDWVEADLVDAAYVTLPLKLKGKETCKLKIRIID